MDMWSAFGPNKKISVFQVTGLKIEVGYAHFFIFFLEKNIITCILKGIWPFKMHNR